MRRLSILVILTLAAIVIAACGDDDPIQTGETEEFAGYYLVRHKTIIGSKTDSLTMTLEDERSYEVNFYPYLGTDTSFCSHSGVVSSWGARSTEFATSDIQTGGCDAVRIPTGQFQANWTNTPDSIVFTRETEDSLWRLVLTPQPQR